MLCPHAGLLGDQADGDDIPVDFLGDGALLLCGGGDLAVHVADGGNGTGDGVQGGSGSSHLCYPVLGAIAASAHDLHRIGGTHL
ncbi:hypothetical protein D3C86_1994880 [compost metagenome]